MHQIQHNQKDEWTEIGNDGIFEGIRKNWAIILFIMSLIITWSTQQNKIDTVEKETATNTNDIKTLQSQVNKIDNQTSGAIIEIKANYIFIKEKLEALERR